MGHFKIRTIMRIYHRKNSRAGAAIAKFHKVSRGPAGIEKIAVSERDPDWRSIRSYR